MQYQQGNLNAEFVDDKNQYLQQPGGYGVPIQGQPVMGQPVQNPYQQFQYSQPYQQQQMAYNQYAQQPPNFQQPYQQQVILVPTTVMVAQPINPIVAKEIALRQYSRYFYGCNCCFGVLAFVFLIVRCVAAFHQGGSEIAAGVMYIISDFSFVVGVICGLYSLSRYVEKLLVHYQLLVVVAMLFEIIGSIIMFTTYGSTSKNNDDRYDNSDDSSDNSDDRKNVSLVFFIVSLIILIICYGWFIRYARQIRVIMIDLIQARKNPPPVNQQPQQFQGVLIGGN